MNMEKCKYVVAACVTAIAMSSPWVRGLEVEARSEASYRIDAVTAAASQDSDHSDGENGEREDERRIIKLSDLTQKEMAELPEPVRIEFGLTLEEEEASIEGDYEAPDEQTPKSDGPKLTPRKGVNKGPNGKETWYNLDMSGICYLMDYLGYSYEDYPYWVREDGVKMFGDYIMVAADLSIWPKGTILECSLGTAMVVDTGKLEPYQLDIAVDWE